MTTMNNTEQEYSDEDLAAIKMARECSLMGNTATDAAVVRFARKLMAQGTNKAERQAIAALRSVAGQIVTEYNETQQANPELFSQASAIAVRVKLLRQLQAVHALTDMVAERPGDDLFAMLDDRDVLRRSNIEQQLRIKRAERALVSFGFTYHEGVQDWQSPRGLCASPLLEEISVLRAHAHEMRQRAESAESGLAWWVHTSAMEGADNHTIDATYELQSPSYSKKMFLMKLDQLRAVIAGKDAPQPGNLLLQENGYPHIQPSKQEKEQLAADLAAAPVQYDGSVNFPPAPPNWVINFDEMPDVQVTPPQDGLQVKWDTIPSRYNWVAMDESGEVYAYAEQPQKLAGDKFFKSGLSAVFRLTDSQIISLAPKKYWRQSYQHRPEAGKTSGV